MSRSTHQSLMSPHSASAELRSPMVSLTALLMLASVSAVQLPLAAFVVTQGYWPTAAVAAMTAVKARKVKEMRCMVSFVGGEGRV